MKINKIYLSFLLAASVTSLSMMMGSAAQAQSEFASVNDGEYVGVNWITDYVYPMPDNIYAEGNCQGGQVAQYQFNWGASAGNCCTIFYTSTYYIQATDSGVYADQVCGP